MEKYIINTEFFSLPFLIQMKSNMSHDDFDQLNNESKNDLEVDIDDNEDSKSPDEQFEEMQDLIPIEAVFIGSINTEFRNWTSWAVKEEYYIIRLKDEEFDWALFRIYWDDNIENWEWASDARLKGIVDTAHMAAEIILKKVWNDWGIDYEKGNTPYNEIIEAIK